MIRPAIVTALLFATVVAVGQTWAVEKTDQQGNKRTQAVVTKVDVPKNAISVKVLGKTGQDRERVFRLSRFITLYDDAGNETELDAFQPGDEICVTEKDDEVVQIRQHTRAKVVHVDPQAGTIALNVTDRDGRENERTFRLDGETEYIDSNGRIAVLDIFQSGDKVLFVEADGKITGIKKAERRF